MHTESSAVALRDPMVVKLEEARTALKEATDLSQVKKIHDTAAAYEVYARRQALGEEAVGYAFAIKTEALARLGELLRDMPKAKGVRSQLHGRDASGGTRAEPPEDDTPTLASLGITKKISAVAQQLAALPARERKAIAARETTLARAKKEAKVIADTKALKKAQQEITQKKRTDLASVCDLRVCSCADLFRSGIRPDAVITDPPYPREFLPVFSELAEGCKKANVPLVAVMSGQSYLPEVLKRLCEHLTYRWTLAYLTPGGQAVQQWEAKVNTAWKPVFLFGVASEWFGDVTRSNVNDNDKRFHGWGQSESGMGDLVERLTKPGQLVCDPFMGGGTTAVVSLALGRRFVGCDVDADSVARTQMRVEAGLVNV